jgi:hypothetical protein
VLALTLPALIAYIVAATAALQGSGGIAEEVNAGTLEQVHLSPARPSLLAAGRLAALAVEGLIPAAVLALAFGLGYRPHWAIRPDALVPLALTIADALGYGLLMMAATVLPRAGHGAACAGRPASPGRQGQITWASSQGSVPSAQAAASPRPASMEFSTSTPRAVGDEVPDRPGQ